MPSAAEHIGRVIDAADNEQVRFDQFMTEALYGAQGFYPSGVGRAGRRLELKGSAEKLQFTGFFQFSAFFSFPAFSFFSSSVIEVGQG